MDYKFINEEIYVIDWKDTKNKDVNDYGGLSVGVVVHQNSYYVTIAGRWLFPGGPKDIQVIRKRDITEVHPLTYADRDDKVVDKKYTSIKCDTEGEKYFYVKSGHGC